MDDEKGYIYILINPSIDGLIKVGKTTRTPDERAKELSGSTSIPTPFVVVYQMPVKNCSEAEKYVHTRLEINGSRVNDNREFFYVITTDAINIFMDYKKNEDENKNSSQNKKMVENASLFKEIEEKADKYYFGLDDFLQNHKMALSIYKKSMKLGSSTAPGKIGRMYKLGEGCRKNIETSISFFMTGIQREDYKCYFYLMEIYLEINNIGNFLKCWLKLTTLQRHVPISLIDEYMHKMIILNLVVEHRDLLYSVKDELIDYQKIKETTLSKRIYGVENFEYQSLQYAQYVLNTPITEKILRGGEYISQCIDKRDQKLGITKLPPIRIKGVDYI